MSEADRERWRAEVAQAAADEHQFRIEYAIRHKSGAVRHLLEHGRSIARTEVQARQILGLILDVSDRKNLEQKLQESEGNRRELSAQLLSALETERRRIAAELHDGLGQILTGIKMRVEAAFPLIHAGEVAKGEETLASIVPMIQETMDEVRTISMALRPSILDDLGVVATIGWFCRNFTSTCPDVRIEQDIRVRERDISPDLKIVIYRVLQEAMNNVAKHARAEFVRVRLSRLGSDIELIIEDNGRGFDVAQVSARKVAGGGTGLANMRQRLDAIGGDLSIRSTSRIGTVVRAIMPCGGDLRGS